MNTVLVYVTAATREDAVTLGRDVVGRRLAACANILGEMTSIYRWQGEIAEDREIAMILKTQRNLIDPLVARIKALHNYDCPCIVAVGIEGCNSEFLDWIAEETSPEA